MVRIPRGFAYLAILFLVAQWADRMPATGTLGERVFNSPLVYTLSIAVYCTSWTFFGAVGTASRNGLEFMAIYLGPSLVFFGWVFCFESLRAFHDRYGSRASPTLSLVGLVKAKHRSACDSGRDDRHNALHCVAIKAVALSFEVLTVKPAWL